MPKFEDKEKKEFKEKDEKKLNIYFKKSTENSKNKENLKTKELIKPLIKPFIKPFLKANVSKRKRPLSKRRMKNLQEKLSEEHKNSIKKIPDPIDYESLSKKIEKEQHFKLPNKKSSKNINKILNKKIFSTNKTLEYKIEQLSKTTEFLNSYEEEKKRSKNYLDKVNKNKESDTNIIDEVFANESIQRVQWNESSINKPNILLFNEYFVDEEKQLKKKNVSKK